MRTIFSIYGNFKLALNFSVVFCETTLDYTTIYSTCFGELLHTWYKDTNVQTKILDDEVSWIFFKKNVCG
jgi:hypothetical protein